MDNESNLGENVSEVTSSNTEPSLVTTSQPEVTTSSNIPIREQLANIAGISDLKAIDQSEPTPLPAKDISHSEEPSLQEEEFPEVSELELEEWYKAILNLRGFINKKKPQAILISGNSSRLLTGSLNMQNNTIEGIPAIILNRSENWTLYKTRSHQKIKSYYEPLVFKILKKLNIMDSTETDEERESRILLEQKIPRGVNHIMFLDDFSDTGEKMRGVRRKLKKHGIQQVDMGVLVDDPEAHYENEMKHFTGSKSLLLYELIHVLAGRTSNTSHNGQPLDNPTAQAFNSYLQSLFSRLQQRNNNQEI